MPRLVRACMAVHMQPCATVAAGRWTGPSREQVEAVFWMTDGSGCRQRNVFSVCGYASMINSRSRHRLGFFTAASRLRPAVGPAEHALDACFSSIAIASR